MTLSREDVMGNTRWDAPELYFYVREPFPGRAQSVRIVFGTVDSSKPLSLFSDMAENGIIFSDGMESDCLSFSSGMSLEVRVAARQGRLVV